MGQGPSQNRREAIYTNVLVIYYYSIQNTVYARLQAVDYTQQVCYEFGRKSNAAAQIAAKLII